MPGTHLRPIADRVHARHASLHRSDDGFTLMEVIVATAIFLIVATAATLATTSGVKASSATHNRVVSTNLAQQALEQAQTTPKATLTAVPTTTTTATVGSGSYRVVRSISFTPSTATSCPTTVVTGTPYAIIVHVSATPLGDTTRSVQMDTVIAC